MTDEQDDLAPLMRAVDYALDVAVDNGLLSGELAYLAVRRKAEQYGVWQQKVGSPHLFDLAMQSLQEAHDAYFAD